MLIRRDSLALATMHVFSDSKRAGTEMTPFPINIPV
jgi:hypothetical protein